jgi:CBS domain containing-hemolysin-like protein
MDDFAELMEWRLDDLDAESVTVGGWTIERYGTFPKEGDTLTFRNIELKVLEMDGLRVSRVMVEVKEEEPENE